MRIRDTRSRAISGNFWTCHFLSTALLGLMAGLWVTVPLNGATADRLYVIVSPLSPAGPSAIVAFDVDEQGLLTQRESYPTGGSGYGGDSGQKLALHPSGRFLFAPNNASGDVSVFAIGADGTLTPVTGSPFVTGNGPMAVAVNPNGQQTYVTDWRDSTISVLSLDSLGRLSPTQTLAAAIYPRDIVVDPLGRCLYAADMGSGLRAYDLKSPDGQLREIPGSPFSGFPSSRPYYVQSTGDGRRLFMLDLDAGLAVYDLGPNGSPSLAGATDSLGFSEHMQVMPSNDLVYVGLPFQSSFLGFSVGSNAVPTELTASPFIAELAVVGFACPPSGSRLYVATRENAWIQTFAVAANGSLTKLGNSLHLADPEGRSPNGLVYWNRGSRNSPPIAMANLSPLFAILPGETNSNVLAPNNVAADVVLNGSHSSDADNDPLQFSWYADGQSAAFATGPISTNLFAVGTHNVSLVVSDGHDTATARLSFEIITPATAVGQIILLVDQASMADKNKQPLIATLSTAMASFGRGNFSAGLNQLSAFQRLVRAQVAPESERLANDLIAASEQIGAGVRAH